MKRINNYLNFRFARRVALILIVSAWFFPVNSLLAVYSPIDYFKITYEPAIFSKTEIMNGDDFYATIKSKGIAIKNPPSSAEAVKFSYRYTAANKATGEELVLNPLHTVTVEPFPQKQGEIYEITNVAPLRFPAGSEAGDYTVIEEIINIEMKDQLGWQNAPKPSKPPEPVKPSAPSKPSEPTKPPEPTKPSAPTQPSAPSQPSGTGGGGTKPSKPAEPSKPPEPSRPSEPTKPSEPTRPSEPSRPPGPRREIGVVAYSPISMSALTVSALTISPALVIGGTPSVGTVTLSRPAPAGGQVVQLSATHSGILNLPASMTVAAGAREGTFNISTKAVASPVPVDVTITASLKNSRRSVRLTINPTPAPLTISSLTVSPNSVVGGGVNSVGTVTLSSAAPADGQVVILSVNPSYPVGVRSSITVKAGESSGTFNITTYRVGSPVNVPIRASLNNSQKTAQLTVNPTLAVSKLVVSLASVTAGASSVGTVTLNSPAPTGGQVVVLSTNSNLLTLPVIMTVKAGETSGTFNIPTNTVTSPVNATIIATLYNSQKTALLTINPPPPSTIAVSTLTVSPDSVVNGAISVGTVKLSAATFKDQVVQLSATPSGPLSIPVRVVVRAGTISAQFSILTNAVTSSVNVTITATLGSSKKTAPLTINPPPLVVSALTVSPASVMSGTSAVGAVRLNRAAPAGGQVVPLSVTPRGSLTLPASVTVKAGETSGAFNITTNAVTSPVNVTVIATLINSQKTAPLTINPIPRPCPNTCRPAQNAGGGFWSGPNWVTKCNSNEVAQTWFTCPQTSQFYSCGFWGMRTCSATVNAICCGSK